MNIVLIGYRGTGKTTVARELATRLKWDWLDADVELERCAGRSITAIFSEQGEPAFRDLETDVVRSFSALDRHVLALGGGAVLRPENRQIIRGLGRVAWLQADPQTIHTRLTTDSMSEWRRPNLTQTGGLAEVVELLQQRTPLYRECSELEIDTASRSPAEIAAEIHRRFQSHLGASAPT